MDNYEQKYKNALSWMQSLYKGLHGKTKEEAETYFPELAESEHERIRKAMIDFFKHEREEGITVLHYGVNIERMIAWLEKQGMCKLSHDDEIMIKQLTEYFTTGHGLQNTKETVVEWLGDIKEKLGKQGEQKSAEDVNLPEFESYLCLMLQKFRTKGMCTNGEIIDYVKEHSQKLRDILVKPALSEEDKNMLKWVTGYLDNKMLNTPIVEERTACKNAIAWLEKLEDKQKPNYCHARCY